MHPIFCTWEISKQSPQIPQQQQQQEEQHVPLPDLSASPQIKRVVLVLFLFHSWGKGKSFCAFNLVPLAKERRKPFLRKKEMDAGGGEERPPKKEGYIRSSGNGSRDSNYMRTARGCSLFRHRGKDEKFLLSPDSPFYFTSFFPFNPRGKC